MRFGRVIVLLAAVGLLVVTPVHAARQFNGTTQNLRSTTAIDLSGQSKVTISFWLWVNAFGNTSGLAFETGTDWTNPANGIIVSPDEGVVGAGNFLVGHNGAANALWYFTRPSAAAWHHYVIRLDRTKASSEVDAVFVDTVSQSLTAFTDGNTAGNFCSCFLNLMARNAATSNWLAGRLAEVAIWGGLLLSQTDVNNLYNSGRGALATSVQRASLIYYWRILGDTSPEPATVGGITLDVGSAAPFVAHPFGDSSPTNKAPKDARSRSRGRGR